MVLNSYKLRKPLGNKKNEFSPEDREKITKLYADFKENELVKIVNNTEFIYREYTVKQPLQRSYSITEESIARMIQKRSLKNFYDAVAMVELEYKIYNGENLDLKEKKKYSKYKTAESKFNLILNLLRAHLSEKKWLSNKEFLPVLTGYLSELNLDKKLIESIADGLSVMDKTAEIQKDKKGHVIYDNDSRTSEFVKYGDSIDDYMKKEVLPHVPDAVAFFEEKLNVKNTVIKTGAEIPFTRYFYKWKLPSNSEDLGKQFLELENSVRDRISKLFRGQQHE